MSTVPLTPRTSTRAPEASVKLWLISSRSLNDSSLSRVCRCALAAIGAMTSATRATRESSKDRFFIFTPLSIVVRPTHRVRLSVLFASLQRIGFRLRQLHAAAEGIKDELGAAVAVPPDEAA